MVALLQSYKPTVHYHVVNWKPPEIGWIKYKTDGASKGNLRQSFTILFEPRFTISQSGNRLSYVEKHIAKQLHTIQNIKQGLQLSKLVQNKRKQEEI
ncbi:hypothetical protein H5410_002135 [Solanum commersonii]|uniref:Uncharacterized protein n=1 Tax=Solanum commersonii TaxID=4109 RepID=A0A9J6B1G5_SOLCO|nr:hypothetical protein H5410_002135 [Solanum commersonii]